jgi:magnesium transporter
VTRESAAFRVAGLKWIDIVDPTPAEVERLVREYGLHPEAVADCLDPEHLPKYEKHDGVSFIIVRAWDEASSPTGDSVQALTRKVALFAGTDFLVTIHRKPQPYLSELFAECDKEGHTMPVQELVFRILDAAVITYETPLQRLEEELDRWHQELFAEGPNPPLEKLALFKRQSAVYRRMLQSTLLVFQRFTPPGERIHPVCQNLIEDTQSTHAWADELLDEANNLLQLQFALAAHKTNEVVKILTVFSAFFMPLTFLVGIYGMNFHYMPELSWVHGYAWAWGLMAVMSAGIWLWFKRKGWL